MKPSRPYNRTDRVAHEILNILGLIQTQHIDLSHLGFVTFTGVNISPDLRNAKVFFSLVQPKIDPQKVQGELNKLGKAFRKYLGHELTIKYTPEIKFYYDGTFSYSEKLDKIFQHININESEQGSDTKKKLE